MNITKYLDFIYKILGILDIWIPALDLLPKSASNQLNSTSISIEAEIALFPVSDKPPGHPPNQPPTQQPVEVAR